MNMDNLSPDTFANARPVAEHCAELTWRGPRPEERAEHLSSWCRDLGQVLAQELGQLFSGGKLQVTVAEPEMMAGKAVFERIGAVAVNSLLRCGEGDQTILLSFDLATAVALTDYSFGGDGAMPEEAPTQLPRSAAMLIEQCASMIAQVIAMTNGSAERATGDVLVRSESATRLKPFSAATEVAFFDVTLSTGSERQWSAILAVASDRLDGLLPGMAAGRPAKPRPSAPSDGTRGPFAAMPLPLEAVVSEFDLSLTRLQQLSPGDEIPLTIARELPLRVGEQVFAHGTLGTIENRMALRVTRVPGQRPLQAPPHPAAPTPVLPEPQIEERIEIQGVTA